MYRPEPLRNFPLWPGNPFEAGISTGTASTSTRNLPSGLPMDCRPVPENPMEPGHSFGFPYRRSEDHHSTANSDALTGCRHAEPASREAGIRKRIKQRQSATATSGFLLSASFPQSRFRFNQRIRDTSPLNQTAIPAHRFPAPIDLEEHSTLDTAPGGPC